ncbi:MAG: N-acetylmuramoyl-L-alanine amidase [Rickettsiales bacterium]|jgi:N-acetylmuramoyl-L-alanine amidase|nr:N-acetylmuramoyl-L-alanine amidase [Rickettsiales bacterium]
MNQRGGDFSRRSFLAIAGGAAAVLSFFPRRALAAENEIFAIRTGTQPGNKTRLVIETTQKPSYNLSYPDGLLVVNINARCRAAPSMTEGTLITGIDARDNRVAASLKKSIAPIPNNQILLLEPTGANKWRLVLDFAAGSAAAAQKTASAATAATSKPSGRKPIIVIDPGHGGKDPGCIGGNGTQEKDIVLALAKKLDDRLSAAGYDASLTRKNDTFLNLDTRAGIAQKKKADLFVSIHANANPKKSVRGFSVYTLSQTASDAEAAKLAETENASDKIEIDGFEKFEPEIRNALSSLQQHLVAEDSVAFARKILRATRDGGIARVEKARRFAPFAVLKSQVPSCLVEVGHLSNETEEKLLRSADHQNKIVAAIFKAISDYDFVG